jgi:hypothetical protein
MDGYPGWLTSGLIFLLIPGAHDARAAPVDCGNVRGEFRAQGASVPARQAASSQAESMPQLVRTLKKS